MLKKLFALSLIIINLNTGCYASNNISDTLSKLEDAALGIDYPKDKTENRLNRLEKNIYGKARSGSVQSRLAKINKDIAGDVLGQEIAPSSDTFMNEDELVKSDGTENYPILNEIEQKIFLHSEPEKSLHTRIVNIEKKMFNKTFETDDYYTRVERIKSKYYTQYPPIAQNTYPDYPDYRNDYTAFNDSEPEIQSFYAPPTRNHSRQMAMEPYNNLNSADEYQLMALEQKILKNTYPNQSINERLSRLENKVFDTDFFYDDEKIRIDRLASASKAKKSSHKYDNNKFYSKLNTAMQIGTMVLMVLAFIL